MHYRSVMFHLLDEDPDIQLKERLSVESASDYCQEHLNANFPTFLLNSCIDPKMRVP